MDAISIDKLNAVYMNLLREVNMSFTRYLYQQINWDNRLIMIKGAKGVGKTTMLLQHISRTFTDPTQALYASVDNSWFATHSIVDLAEYLFTHGMTHLFLDEVHKYHGWDQQVKEIYDSYPQLKVVITGSSMLQLEESQYDLGRRCRQYTLFGLSFREYLLLEGVADWPVLTLDDIVSKHVTFAADLTHETHILQHFSNYLKFGYYPFYKESGDGYSQRLETNIYNIIEVDIPSIEKKIEYESVYKMKILLGVLAELNPYTLNINDLSKSLNSSRDVIYKMLHLMHRAALLRRLFQKPTGMKILQKPEKILFDNTNLMYALSSTIDVGTSRETFVANMLSVEHKICMPSRGDLLVDNQYLLEVGGKNKDYHQVAGEANSFVVRDNIEIGAANKIPLWMFGLLY